LVDYFINEKLIPLARDPATLLVFPHAQRTGGRTMRSKVLVGLFGEKLVYNSHYLPETKEWYELTDEDIAPFRAYVDIFNFSEPNFTRPFVLLGLIRHPLYRAVSYYFYVRQRAKHTQHELAKQTTMEEYFRQGSALKAKYHSNVQCMRICGQADTDAAINLIRRRYVGVGLTGKVGLYIAALGERLGWPRLNLEKLPPDEERYGKLITPEYRDMVLALNQADLQLYEALTEGRI
jgi:hypothetical protein